MYGCMYIKISATDRFVIRLLFTAYGKKNINFTLQ